MPGKPGQHPFQYAKFKICECINTNIYRCHFHILRQNGSTIGDPKMCIPERETDGTTYVWSAVTAFLEHDGISPVKACLGSEAISLGRGLSSLCAWI